MNRVLINLRMLLTSTATTPSSIIHVRLFFSVDKNQKLFFAEKLQNLCSKEREFYVKQQVNNKISM